MKTIILLAIVGIGPVFIAMQVVHGQNQSANEDFDRKMNITKHAFDEMANEPKPPCIIFNSGNFKVLDLNCKSVNNEIEYYLNAGWVIVGISDNTKNQTNYMYLVNR